jgi:hypothetical protein
MAAAAPQTDLVAIAEWGRRDGWISSSTIWVRTGGRRWRLSKPLRAAVVLVAALCACSGDDSSDDATTTDVSTATPVTTTTEAVAVTTEPDPTVAPATSPTTTTPTTTSTTTTVAAPTVEEQIAADYQLIYDGYWACLRAPLNCDESWLVPDSGSALAMQATMQALFDRGRYVGGEDPGYFVIESITVGADGTTAEIVTCWWSTAILYGPPVDDSRPVGPDNPATIANNTPDSGRQRDSLQLVEGRWLVESSDLFGESGPTNLCPAEP